MRTPALPLLSRVADAVYWMARYIERAENIARLLAGTESRIGQKAGDSAMTGHNGGPSL